MAGLGIDIGGTSDIDPMLSFTDEKTAVAEAVIVMLSHDPGRLWWAPELGHDTRQYLHVPFEADEIEKAVQSTAETEERVQSALVTVTYDNQSKTITMVCRLTLINNAGDVTLTLSVSEAGEVISASIN